MEARTLDTGERILDAAERLFMAHGYEGTSMRQITSEAGVNLAAVNYHFGSKDALETRWWSLVMTRARRGSRSRSPLRPR